MGIKIKTVKNDFPKMEAALQIIDGSNINVGVQGEHAWLAGIHEYGCRIKITPKMRAWLRRNGLNVKNSTKEIVIPERSFLRSGFDDVHMKAIERAERILPLVIEGKVPETQLYELVGTILRDGIKDYARDLKEPEKHPFTLKREGGAANPLINTGDMINEIEYEVKK